MKNAEKIICIILALAMCIGITACSGEDKINTDDFAISLAGKKGETNLFLSYDPEHQEFISDLSLFSANLCDALFREFNTDKNNLCFSPVSVYMALALAAECTGGQTRAQLLDALGMSYEEVKEFTGILYSVCNRSYTGYTATGKEKTVAFSELNNSVWLDGSVGIDKHSADSLAKNYNADIFGVDFGSGEADRVIKQYISDKTHGLIDGDIRMDPLTVCVLLSTLYLKDVWFEGTRTLEKTDKTYEFKNSDGSSSKLRLLMSEYLFGNSYKGENYESFYAETMHGYKLHFMLPDSGSLIGDVFTEDNISKLLSVKSYGGEDEENRQVHYTRVLFPEFEAKFDGDIEKVLEQSLGITDLFSEEKAEFSALSYDYQYNLFCQKVVHKTVLKVDEQGIEGAAITAMALNGSAGPGTYEKIYHDLVIDRAFGFILTDPQGVVLFAGAVNSK